MHSRADAGVVRERGFTCLSASIDSCDKALIINGVGGDALSGSQPRSNYRMKRVSRETKRRFEFAPLPPITTEDIGTSQKLTERTDGVTSSSGHERHVLNFDEYKYTFQLQRTLCNTLGVSLSLALLVRNLECHTPSQQAMQDAGSTAAIVFAAFGLLQYVACSVRVLCCKGDDQDIIGSKELEKVGAVVMVVVFAAFGVVAILNAGTMHFGGRPECSAGDLSGDSTITDNGALQ